MNNQLQWYFYFHMDYVNTTSWFLLPSIINVNFEGNDDLISIYFGSCKKSCNSWGHLLQFKRLILFIIEPPSTYFQQTFLKSTSDFFYPADLEGFLSCGPLIQTEIDPSVTPNSALFSWWSLRNWFISPQIHKTKIPLLRPCKQGIIFCGTHCIPWLGV